MYSTVQRGLRLLRGRGPVTLFQRASSLSKTKAREYLTPTEKHIDILKQRDDLVIAEIGVWRGANAERLANVLDLETMYLIDPYDEYDEYDESKSDSNELRRAREEAHTRLAGQSNVNWIQKYSSEAVDEIKESLDYVYIDGNHGYEFVREDIENYYDLLETGGILAGDDIDWDGVARAFAEFAVENDFQPNVEPYHPDWYFVKDDNDRK
jgi:hypothetical protein